MRFSTLPCSALSALDSPPVVKSLTMGIVFESMRPFKVFPISAERAFPSQRTFETYRLLVNRAVTSLKILVGDGNAAVSRLVTGDNDALGIGEVTDA